MSEDSTARQGIQSVEVAAAIMSEVALSGGMLPLKDIAQKTGMPPGKVHRYLTSLTRSGLMAQDEKNGQYYIGSLSISVGLAGLRLSNPIRKAFEVLPQLRDGLGESVCLAIWGEHGPTVIALEEGSQQVTMNIRPGSSLPTASSAIGLVFLAFLPDAVTQKILKAEYTSKQAKTLPKRKALKERLGQIRQDGAVAVESYLLPGVSAIAAPVFDHQGRLSSVIAVVGYQGSLDTSLKGEPATGLIETTMELSKAMGYTPNESP